MVTLASTSRIRIQPMTGAGMVKVTPHPDVVTTTGPVVAPDGTFV